MENIHPSENWCSYVDRNGYRCVEDDDGAEGLCVSHWRIRESMREFRRNAIHVVIAAEGDGQTPLSNRTL